VRYCHQPTADSLELYAVTGRADISFGVNGLFAPGRSYAAADLSRFSGFAERGSARYTADNTIGGSTASLALTDMAANGCMPVSFGVAHGTATAELVEMLDTDGGTASPRHLTINATF